MIAVTGGTGFIGRSLIRAMDRPLRHIGRQDLASVDLPHLLEGCDTLVHLACPLSSRNPSTEIEKEFFQTTKELFLQFRAVVPDGKIIFASTAGEIYDCSRPILLSEKSPVHLHSPYARLKFETERLLSELTNDCELSAISLRIANPYFYDPTMEKQRGLVPTCMDCAVKTKPLLVYDNMLSTKDYIFMTDLIDLMKLTIAAPGDPGRHEIYNVGTGTSISLENTIHLIEEIFQVSIELSLMNEGLEPRHCALDIAKIESRYNWKATHSLVEGVRKNLSFC